MNKPVQEILICEAAKVEEKGAGVRFPLRAGSDETTGFVIRYNQKLHAYLNRCAHVPMELDWEQGQFFESGQRYIMCATHGAIYTPEGGQCAGGPCRGGRLRQIAIVEKEGMLYWLTDDYLQASAKTDSN